MRHNSPQEPTGFHCTVCGGVAVVDMGGIYLCACDAIDTMSDGLLPDRGEAAAAEPTRADAVDHHRRFASRRTSCAPQPRTPARHRGDRLGTTPLDG